MRAKRRAPYIVIGPSLSSHLNTLPKPESLRHLKILPGPQALRAAEFSRAAPLAGLAIIAPEPTVRAGFLTVGCAEAWEGRGARRLNVQPCQGERRGRVGAARYSRSSCWSIRCERANGSVCASTRRRAATFFGSASGHAHTRANGVCGRS